MNNFPTTVGIEYAVIPARMSVSDSYRLFTKFGDWKHEQASKFKIQLHDDEGFKYEVGAWEISSKPLKNFEEVKKFYDSVRNIYDAFGKEHKVKLVANSEYKSKRGRKIYLEGGGGHLHLGQPKRLKSELLKKFNYRLFMEVLNKPYLHWVMSEWCDNDILLSSFLHAFGKRWGVKVLSLRSELISSLIHKYPLTDWGYGPMQMRSAKEFNSIKGCFPTHEFRFFAAPIDYQHLVDNINLALAIWEKTLKHLDVNYGDKLIYPSISSIKSSFCLTQSKNYLNQYIINQFKIYLIELGLNPENYERYQKNFDLRLKYGKLITEAKDIS